MLGVFAICREQLGVSVGIRRFLRASGTEVWRVSDGLEMLSGFAGMIGADMCSQKEE